MKPAVNVLRLRKNTNNLCFTCHVVKNETGGKRSKTEENHESFVYYLPRGQEMKPAVNVEPHHDQQMHNYFTNYNSYTLFDTIVSSSGHL